MPKAVKAPARPRRTKAEVQEEFQGIRQQTEAARDTADPKLEEAARLREAEVRQSVEGITVDTVVQRISGLGLEIGRALADISTKLSHEVELLSSVRDAVTLERRELERLHKIDVAATALDQMVQDYAHQKQELESEITAQRAVWEEEVRQTERERKEQDEALRKQRQREIEDYEYKKQLERKKAQDKYDEEVRLQEKKNAEKQETLDKSWKQREASLKESEEELARLRKEVADLPARIERETAAAAKEATRAADARLEQQMLILKKDSESERRVAELQVKSLEQTITQQSAQLASLQKQLDEAKQQVQDIAVKAIEGASGARALAHINQIAMEQAKNRPQS